MALVLKLDAFYLTRPRWLFWGKSFQCLHTRLFVGRHSVNPPFLAFFRLRVGFAYLTDFLCVTLWVLLFCL